MRRSRIGYGLLVELGFAEVVIVLVLVAVQIAVPVAVIWLIVRFAIKKQRARTETQVAELDARVALLEGSTPRDSADD
jgi:hypothetical protein